MVRHFVTKNKRDIIYGRPFSKIKYDQQQTFEKSQFMQLGKQIKQDNKVSKTLWKKRVMHKQTKKRSFFSYVACRSFFKPLSDYAPHPPLFFRLVW